LLAHCGGGQDKPGLPWPLSEAPRLTFFSPFLRTPAQVLWLFPSKRFYFFQFLQAP
jgi:hypothetical protein